MNKTISELSTVFLATSIPYSSEIACKSIITTFDSVGAIETILN